MSFTFIIVIMSILALLKIFNLYVIKFTYNIPTIEYKV